MGKRQIVGKHNVPLSLPIRVQVNNFLFVLLLLLTHNLKGVFLFRWNTATFHFSLYLKNKNKKKQKKYFLFIVLFISFSFSLSACTPPHNFRRIQALVLFRDKLSPQLSGQPCVLFKKVLTVITFLCSVCLVRSWRCSLDLYSPTESPENRQTCGLHRLLWSLLLDR